jgi:hypothetical protein
LKRLSAHGALDLIVEGGVKALAAEAVSTAKDVGLDHEINTDGATELFGLLDLGHRGVFYLHFFIGTKITFKSPDVFLGIWLPIS